MEYVRTSASRTPVSLRISYILMLLGILCSFGACDNWSDRQVAETKRRGENVRHALDQFHQDTGSYPTDLEVLSSKYLHEIPQPTVGKRKWNYEVFGGGASYALSVQIGSQSEPLLQATSESGWTFDTK